VEDEIKLIIPRTIKDFFIVAAFKKYATKLF
jgi:hypothetical protein